MSKKYFTGLDEVLRNLNKEVEALKKRTIGGMWEAGLEVQRRSMELSPTDTGNLRASHYAIAYQSNSGPAVEIGATASYAPFVHERVELRHEVGQAKFLETALMEVPVIDIIVRAAKESE